MNLKISLEECALSQAQKKDDLTMIWRSYPLYRAIFYLLDNARFYNNPTLIRKVRVNKRSFFEKLVEKLVYPPAQQKTSLTWRWQGFSQLPELSWEFQSGRVSLKGHFKSWWSLPLHKLHQIVCQICLVLPKRCQNYTHYYELETKESLTTLKV